MKTTIEEVCIAEDEYKTVRAKYLESNGWKYRCYNAKD